MEQTKEEVKEEISEVKEYDPSTIVKYNLKLRTKTKEDLTFEFCHDLDVFKRVKNNLLLFMDSKAADVCLVLHGSTDSLHDVTCIPRDEVTLGMIVVRYFGLPEQECQIHPEVADVNA